MTSTKSHEIIKVEALMLHHFKTLPFHNLKLIYGDDLQNMPAGGTCSDKTLSFIADAKEQRFDVALHSAFIGGEEIHRLAKFNIGGRHYFADVGNGWPSIKLYPSDTPVDYQCYGMKFRTEIDEDYVTVFHKKNNTEALQMKIPRAERNEADILRAIENRFTSGIVYPFSDSLRFSQIVDNRFLFLRGDRLEIYGVDGFEWTNTPENLVFETLSHHFNIFVKDTP